MAPKRDFSEIGSPGPDQEGFNGAAKKRKHNTRTKHRPNEGTSGWAKKRTRTIERLLKRNHDLPANVHNDLERELAALKSTVSDKAFQKKRSAMISKYHMVRFFERKKASRLARQLRKKIEETEAPEELEELKRDLHVAEVDEAYTQHFPHAETYISLYPIDKREKEADDDKNDYTPLKQRGLLHTERPPIWSEVEQALKEGPNALRGLRERRSPPGGAEDEAKPQRRENKPKAQANVGKPVAKTQQRQQMLKEKSTSNNKEDSEVKMNRRERRRLMHQNKQPAVKSDDDDSDGGGFFEED
ncbi:rRNA-processing protein efg1 [Fusarium piperis]|uniref:rRNA-processing protein EFG1 n=1 Tax=Fusarium piperis TaxID=1435070 RepID=A0A9W8TD89_9HYPO|nr:rRNA-processing protein efg1 [Fusarium piperis]